MFAHLSPKERWEKAFEIVDHAWQAPFYAEKYQGLQLPRDPESWRRLPLLERADLLSHRYPESTDMLTCPIEGLLVIATGGSTGVARYTVFTWDEWDRFVETQTEALRQIGVRSTDVVANLFLAGHLWPSFLGAHDSLRKLNAVHLPISSNIPQEEIMRLCQEFQPTVMISLPTLFIFLADLARKNGVKFDRLRLIGYIGEQMSDTAQKHVRDALGVEEIRPLGYSSADAGIMGYPCDQSPTGTYHLPSAFQFLEILDPDSHEPVGFGTSGEMVVTNLGRRSMPIVRYRIGDLGHFVPGRCPCGDANPRFVLEGRAGDDFKLGGGFISMQPIEEVLATFPLTLSLNFQVQIEDVDNQVDLVIAVESPDVEAAEAQTETIGDALCKRIPEFAKGLEMGFFHRLAVEPVPLGSLPRNPNSGKVKRLLDRRLNEAARPATSPPEAPHDDGPRAEAAHAEAPDAEARHGEAPQAEAPQAEAPLAEAARSEAPGEEAEANVPEPGPNEPAQAPEVPLSADEERT
jgi:phenylacetate-CoA ligase